MKNPWEELIEKVGADYQTKDKLYIVQDDLKVIKKFNENLSPKSKETYQIHYHIHPSHYTGNIRSASVILLATNPGYLVKEEFTLYINPAFHKEVIENLKFNTDTFINRDESRRNDSNYWSDRTKELREIFGDDIVDKHLAFIQFFPYHSIKFRKIPKKYFEDGERYLKTQKFGFELVREAIKEGKMIIILRSKKHWLKAVPELIAHKKRRKVLEVKNARQPYLTPKNLKDDGFEKLIEYIKQQIEK